MLSRVFYTLSLCKQHWQQLCPYMSDPALRLGSLLELQPGDLMADNIKILILDFDGVLAAHAELMPREEIIRWLHNFKDFPIYILSNKPTAQRQQYFAEHLPNIKFIVATRKKPYPDGVNEVLKQTQLPAAQIMLVDDRLVTGILAAVSVGIQARLITNPYIDLAKRPIREIGFILLRKIEWLACKITSFCAK